MQHITKFFNIEKISRRDTGFVDYLNNDIVVDIRNGEHYLDFFIGDKLISFEYKLDDKPIMDCNAIGDTDFYDLYRVSELEEDNKYITIYRKKES